MARVKAILDIKSHARSYTAMATRVLEGLALQATNETVRLQAAIALLDRGWGKPLQETLSTRVNVTARQLTDDELLTIVADDPKLIEHTEH